MLEQNGDIWTWWAEKRWIVITTNIGWKSDGANPMGAGTAKDAARKYPELPKWYGEKCQKYGANIAVTPYVQGRLFLFPTKALNEEQPYLSWKDDSSIDLIRRSTKQLQALVEELVARGSFISKVGVPLVGCKNGNLSRRDVLPILHKYLDDRFVLLER